MRSPCALGFDSKDVVALLNSGNTRSSSHFSTGILTVINDGGGLREIEFSQNADDSISTFTPNIILTKANKSPFDSGLQRAVQTCSFEPAITATIESPWTADCVTVRESLGGDDARVRFQAFVDHWVTDTHQINRAIDRIVGLIPEGERIVTNEPIEYVWRDGRVIRDIDVEALERAEGLKFRSRARRRLFIIADVALIGILVFFLIRRQWVRQ